MCAAQAYINHVWCRELQIKMGKEQELFQGLARLYLDTFSTEPVLLLSEDCNAAGILLTSQQEKQLVTALQVCVQPGLLWCRLCVQTDVVFPSGQSLTTCMLMLYGLLAIGFAPSAPANKDLPVPEQQQQDQRALHALSQLTCTPMPTIMLSLCLFIAM